MLRDSQAGPACGIALVDAIRIAPAKAVRELDLYGCALHDDGALPLLGAVAERPSGLGPETIDLGANGLSLPAAASIAPLLHNANEGPVIRSLRLSRNELHGDAVLALLAPPLSPDGRLSLTTLALAFNPIGPSGGAALGAALASRRLPELQVLQLAGCRLGAGGATAIAAGLAAAASLVHLDVSDNSIGDEGCGACAAQLPSSTVHELLLARNQLSDASADALANALGRRRGCRLRVLSLASNALRDAGVAALAASLGGGSERGARPNRFLRSLCLRDNRLSDASVVALCDALVENASLTALDCSANRRIRPSALTHLDALLAHNRAPAEGDGVAPNDAASRLVPSHVQRLFTQPPDDLLIALPPAVASDSPAGRPEHTIDAHRQGGISAGRLGLWGSRAVAPANPRSAAELESIPIEVREHELCAEMEQALRGVQAQLSDAAVEVAALRHREDRLMRVLQEEAGLVQPARAGEPLGWAPTLLWPASTMNSPTISARGLV